MGMFDYLKCELPLPEGQDAEYQTKDTDSQFMMHHTITAAGRLILHHHDIENTPDNELPDKNFPLMGCIRAVAGSERDIDEEHDGDIIFYGKKLTYRATFRAGNCVEICRHGYSEWEQVWAKAAQ